MADNDKNDDREDLKPKDIELEGFTSDYGGDDSDSDSDSDSDGGGGDSELEENATQVFQVELDREEDEELPLDDDPRVSQGEESGEFSIWIEVPEQETKNYPIKEGQTLSFGRLRGDVLVPHRSVSGLHCTFSLKEGVFSLTDKGSSNGTFFNKERVKPNRPVLVDPEDRVQMGLVKSWVYRPLLTEEENPPVPPPQPVVAPSKKEKGKKEEGKKERKAPSRISPPHSKLPPSRKKKTYDLASPFFRLVALCGDTIISYIIGLQVIKSELGLGITKEITRLLSSFVEGVSEAHILFVWAAFFRPLCSLFFGVSFMQAIMGMRGAHGYLRNRIGGFIRELLDLALGSFLIFDIPLLFSRRSLKEFLSGTAVVNGPRRSLRFLGILWVFVLFAGAFFIEQFSQWEYDKGLVIGKYTVSPPGKEGDGDIMEKDSFFDLSSKTYQFSSFPRVNRERLTFMLGYNILSHNKKKIFRPRLSLFMKKYDQWASLEIHSVNLLRRDLGEIFREDPSLGKEYPKIAKILEKSSDQKERPEDFKQIQELMKMAFSFNMEMFAKRLFEGNFSSSGFLKLREKLLERFGIDKDAKVQWAEIGNHKFLRVVVEQKQIPNLPSKMYFIPVDTFKGLVYQIDYFTQGAGEVVAQTLLQYLFGESNFYFHEPVDSGEGDLTLGRCVDHLLGKGLSYEQWVPLYKRYSQYVDEVLKKHLKREGGKKKEREFLMRELRSLAEADKVLAKRYEKWSEQFGSRGFQFFLRKLENP